MDLTHYRALTESVNALLKSVTEFQTKLQTLEPAAPAAAAAEAHTSFRPVSLAFHASLSKEERQAQGIFFTPQGIRRRLWEVLETHGVRPSSVLEPSFGSGEFLHDAAAKYPRARLFGVEYNAALHGALTIPGATLVHSDFLVYKAAPVDLIIGNPPYFVTKAKDPKCMTGRGNIYVQFIYKCLAEHLNPGGVLAFVLPTSFYNCSYYQPCRDAIAKDSTVLHCENLEGGFYDTAQDTMLLVLRKEAPRNRHFLVTLHGRTLLSPYATELQRLVQGATTLTALGLQVKTGDIVWNEHKSDLHDTEGTLIIYSSNIVNNTLTYPPLRGEKKQYVRGQTTEPVTGPAILVCRGYGNSFHLSYAFVEAGRRFYGENHINVITAKTATAIPHLQTVLRSFADPRTAQFIGMFVGNGAFSKTELESVLPIFGAC
jgi:adenine-specific DNA-methyltransferase